MNPPFSPLATEKNGACPACESVRLKWHYHGNFRYSIVKCGSCSLVRSEPMPTDQEVSEYYQGFAFQPATQPPEAEIMNYLMQSLLFFGGKPQPGQRFLDFGGGSGVYAKAAEQIGYEATLYDLDETNLVHGREVLRLDKVCGRLEDLPDSHFDIVFAFHVIEHFNSLDRGFSSMLRLLRPGGKLIVATPNCQNFEKYVRWRHLYAYYRNARKCGAGSGEAFYSVVRPDSLFCIDPPRHLFAFSKRSLQAVALRYGLEVRCYTGYNGDRKFDPRDYTLARPTVQFRSRNPKMSLSDAMRMALKIGYATMVRVGLRLLSWFKPDGGEQLYAVFQRTNF